MPDAAKILELIATATTNQRHSQEAPPPGKCRLEAGLHGPLAPGGPGSPLDQTFCGTAHWGLVDVAGECLGWSKERNPGGGMKEQAVAGEDRRCTHRAILASLGLLWAPAGTCLWPFSVPSLSLLLVGFCFPFPYSLTIAIPNAKPTNVGKQTKRDKKFFFLILCPCFGSHSSFLNHELLAGYSTVLHLLWTWHRKFISPFYCREPECTGQLILYFGNQSRNANEAANYSAN